MLVGKVKEFDSKTNSINFGEYKMVIETPSNVDEENIEVTVPGKESGFFEKLKRLFKKS